MTLSSIPARTANAAPLEKSNHLPDQALDAATAGLDFLVRHQVRSADSADRGRFPFCYDSGDHRTLTLTTNWTTGVSIEALLAGYKALGKQAYLDAAEHAVGYLRSLQALDSRHPRLFGVFREVTPQSGMAHPRDALTAAWALLDWSVVTGDSEALERATLFADWFIRVAMEQGYPYWTVRFDDQPWDPNWCGSFHSGSAFFFYRMHRVTGQPAYREAMRTILRFYNQYHLGPDGVVEVVLDRQTLKSLNGTGDRRYTNPGWECMHVYNDDFGALANLAAWQLNLDGGTPYLRAAERFLRRMLAIQRVDGGFGPAEQSIPSAGGAVLIELMAAQALGHPLADGAQLDRAAEHLLALQVRAAGSPADGAFRGFTDQYTLSERVANVRAGAYAILALLRFAGARDVHYFFDSTNTPHFPSPLVRESGAEGQK